LTRDRGVHATGFSAALLRIVNTMLPVTTRTLDWEGETFGVRLSHPAPSTRTISVRFEPPSPNFDSRLCTRCIALAQVGVLRTWLSSTQPSPLGQGPMCEAIQKQRGAALKDVAFPSLPTRDARQAQAQPLPSALVRKSNSLARPLTYRTSRHSFTHIVYQSFIPISFIYT